jgi:hypothetical protein
MPRQQYQIRIDPLIREELRKLLPERLNVSYVVEMFPGLYRRTISRLLTQFTGAEFGLCREALISTWLTPRIAGQHLLADVEDGIKLDQLALAHEVDATALLGKLRGLSPTEAAMLEIFCVGNPAP